MTHAGTHPEDWFRSGAWDTAARLVFETKLARARLHNRPQYLRIKGLALCATPHHRSAGRELLLRVIDEYPDDLVSVAGAHFALGESLAEDGDLDGAVASLRAALRVEADERCNARHGTEMRLAEILIDRADQQNLAEVEELCARAQRHAFTWDEHWRLAVARARLAGLHGDRAARRDHAAAALRLLEEQVEQFPRHPGVGLIDTDRRTVREIRRHARRILGG